MSCQYLLQCLSLGQWFFTCSVYSKRQCCRVSGPWASHLSEIRSEADESSLLPHHLHPHWPMAQPRQQNTRAPAPVGSLPDQRSGHIWTLRSMGKQRECERGLSCILPCGPVGVNMDKHRFPSPHSGCVEVSHFLALSLAQNCPNPPSLLNKQVTWSTLFGPLTYCFCFHTCML